MIFCILAADMQWLKKNGTENKADNRQFSQFGPAALDRHTEVLQQLASRQVGHLVFLYLWYEQILRHLYAPVSGVQ